MPVESFKEEWRRWIQGPDYRILVIEGVDELDPIDNNVDVEVHFDDGRRYGATLFTLQNLHSLLETYKATGECGGGSYFWASQMVIVRSLSPEHISQAIAALIAEGDLDRAFARHAEDTGEELD